MGRHQEHPDQAEWDERYREGDDGGPMWSGEPNGTLVVEVTDLEPGTALDVGCGEGGDAVWLAARGWQVTAVDPSAVALDRGRAAAEQAGVDVDFVHAGLLSMPEPPRGFDLVSAQYPAVPKDADGAVVRTLLDAVAPGGTLLVVHHDVLHDDGHDHGDGHADDDHGFDPDDYVLPHDVAEHLGDEWDVQVSETRPRPGPLPDDARHVRDVVLHARRRA